MQFNEFEDTSDRMIFVQNKRIVYTQDWYYIPEKIQTGIIFDHSIRKLKIKKDNAKFRIEKKHDMYLLSPIYKYRVISAFRSASYKQVHSFT